MPDAGAPGRILVIATGHALSLALLDGGRVLAESHEPLDRGHAEALMPAVAALLSAFGDAGAGVDEIVVEVGPGSFTGLRVGLAAARALGVAWGVPVHGVRSTELVEAEARAAGQGGALIVALGAPRGQIWSEGFDSYGQSSGPPIARQPDVARAAIAADAIIVGSAAAALGGEGWGHPRAAAFSYLADRARAPAELLYIRQEDHDGGR